MAEKNKGLGRGLSALLGSNGVDTEPSLATRRMGLMEEDKNQAGGAIEIAINEIDANSEQPRKRFDNEALAELAASIKQHGVIQPIVVNRMGLRFMVIAGERRLRASRLAGLSTIPAIIKNYSPQQVKEISLIENLQREDLNPIETAKAIRSLMEEFNLTQEVVSDRIGKSRSAIANTLRLLSLENKVQDMVESGALSSGHARTLVTVTRPADQIGLAQKAVDGKLSVREMEQLVKDYFNPKKPVEKTPAPQSMELRELVNNMTRIFATKVSAIGNDSRGRLSIDYYTKDDLDRIVSMLDSFSALKNE